MSDTISAQAARPLARREIHGARAAGRRLPVGYGLLLGACVSVALWGGLIWAAMILIQRA
ncbi:MAG: hypothetical protein DI570_23480 [Phenylobacterium zucineum]|nr:MAG: hypothetical protein DI570_23480 [Phenylobacterium zucineum]